MPATSSVESVHIHEYACSRGVKPTIDRERGIIQGVKILGLESANGRSYPKETIARGMRLYEGAKVNVDHTTEHNRSRSYHDRIGLIRNVRLGEADTGLFADFHFNPKHPASEQLLWDADHAPENVGFSHCVEAKISKVGGKTIVEEIVRVASVDLVADPATTRGLFENQNQDIGESEVELTIESLKSDHASLVEQIGKSAVAAYLEGEEAKKQASDLKALREELDRIKAEKTAGERRAKVDKAIVDAKLPEAIVTDVFKGQCYEAKDDAALTALIEDRQSIAKAAGSTGGNKPKSREQHAADGDTGGAKPGSTKEFVEAITG